MRGQHYRARDKTVRKMGRDGLVEKNLRSGETVRVSRREADRPALPKTADDAMNFQGRRSCRKGDKKAGKKHRGGYSPDFKRPDHGGAGSTQAGLYQPDVEKTDFYREDTVEAEGCGENRQEIFPDAYNIIETDTGIREGSRRQISEASSCSLSYRKKKYISELPAAPYRRNGKNAQQRKYFYPGTRFPDRIPENASDTEFTDRTQENISDTEFTGRTPGNISDTGFPDRPQGNLAGMGPDAMTDMGAVPEEPAGTAQNKQGHLSNRGYIRERPARGSEISGADTEPAKDSSRSRRKKQVYGYAREEKERKKTEEGKAALARREEERHTGNQLSAGEALQAAKKDAEKKSGRRRLYKGQKKKDSRLNFDGEGGMVRGAGMGLAGRAAVKAAGLAAAVLADDRADGQQEDMETEALHGTKQAGERTLRYAMRQSSRRMQKRSRLAGEGSPETDRRKELRKFYQKRRIKKAYAKAKQGEKTAEGAANAAGGPLGKAKSIAAGVFRNKKGLPIAAVLLLLMFLFFSAGLSSCSAMVQGTSTAFIGTTYPSEDEDIYDAEAGYKELEEALDEQINTMETTHPGYDEYRYQVDEITHNPYQLISFLTVLYEEFTYNQIKDILPVLFAEQYRLTVEEITEMRTRTETQTVIDPLTGAETEEEAEVEYEWHVLCICLTNKGFDTVARERLTQEQAQLYAAYNLTYGNRSYLFDIAGIPTESTGGAGYEIPEDALSDEQFARMIQEAEKYLGRAYVWGGSSPETGFDCSGFVSWVINNSGNGWDVGRQTAEGLRGSCTAVSPSEAKPGDLIFFQGTYNTSGASHVGIYAGNGMMIHAGNPIKYSNINTPYWQGHFLSYGRIW